ncbi:unnamed protein product [Porites lobata]|uniref:Uncharacterized protein n=1 Tax=Porites lobata TaxID=104759 RepID=A0ABN8NPB6_9CNID|nr:unnamed protein product [Porites lobata]
MLFSIFERNYNLNCSIEADQLSEYDDDSSDDNDSVVLGGERTWDFTWENGEDIEQGSSLAVVLNQSKKN